MSYRGKSNCRYTAQHEVSFLSISFASSPTNLLADSSSEFSTAETVELVLKVLGFLAVVGGIAMGAGNVAFQIRAGRWANEIERIDKQLDEFYGPLQRLLETNRLMHRILREGKPEEFRTLKELLDEPGFDFSENDKVLIKEIMDIDEQLLKLIDDKGGFLEATIVIGSGETLKDLEISKDDIIPTGDALRDEDILESPNKPITINMSHVLAKACRHFRIIRLAHQKKLKGDVDRFSNYVYPRALNIALDTEIKRLIDRKVQLRKQIENGPQGNTSG